MSPLSGLAGAAERSVASWKAELELDYRREGARTYLAKRRHDGPLVVQKALYPEGEEVCHSIVVHPPAGIAAGDDLAISVSIGEGAAALLTTPGAAKWYRSSGSWARQRVAFDIAGALEWLPQETILFNGALAQMDVDIRLSSEACYIGWEVLCLGRTGSGERYSAGHSVIGTRVSRDGKLLWNERGRIAGGGALLESPMGLAGRSVCGTLLAAAPRIDDATLAACRERAAASGDAAVTRLPGLLVARYLGDSSEAAKLYLRELWTVLRPALLARSAIEPRIWRT
jgi:urease accessory protein